METKKEKNHIILEKPLPEILDDIETSIVTAEKAAAEARQAAAEARKAGEQAAAEVMKKIRKLFLKMTQDITEELEKS
jgi:SMC interacting uncharacterized protein involved in chromosome segregation